MEADRVVVELLANVDGFDSKVKQSAGTFETQMGRIEKAATKAEATVSQSGSKMSTASLQASTRMYQGYSDVSKLLNSSSSPFLIPVKQAPAAAGAIKVVGAAGSVLGGIMGGVVALGVGAAVAALVSLLTTTKDNKDSIEDLVKKLKEKHDQTRLTEAADRAWKLTVEGLTDAIRKQNDELERSLQTERDRANLAKQAAMQLQADARRKRDDAARALADAKKALEAELLAAKTRGQGGGAVKDSEITASNRRINKLRQDIPRLTKELQGFTNAAGAAEDGVRLTAIALSEMNAEAAADPIKGINDRFDQMASAARKAAENNYKLAASLEATLTAINKNRKAALDAERDRQREANKKPKPTDADLTSFLSPVAGGRPSGTFGERRSTGLHAGRDIAVPVGTKVVAPAGGVIIESGNVPGYGNAIFIDHGRGTITRLGHLSQLGVSKGQVVTAGQQIGLSGGAKGAPGSGNSQGPHVHEERRVNGRPVNPAGRFATDATGVAAKGLANAERAEDAEERRLQAFQNELANLLGQEVDARQGLLVSLEEIAKLERDGIEIARVKYNDALASQVETGRLYADEAKQLKAKNDAIAKLRTELVAQREAVRKFREQEQASRNAAELAGAGRDIQMELLQDQATMARTQAQRRDLELRLLDLQFQEEEARLKYLIGYSERLQTQDGISDSEKAEAAAQAEIARLKLASIGQRKAGAVAQAQQGTMGPLQSWADQIPQTAEEMSEALESVAVQGLDGLANSLTEVVMGTKSLGEAFSEMAASVLQDIAKMIIKMLILKALQAAFPGLKLAEGGEVPKMATGGRIVGPGTGTSDSIPIMASAGEFVIRKKSVDRIGAARLHHLNQTGRIPGFAGGGEVRRIRPANVAAAVGGPAAAAASGPPIVFDLRGAVMTEDLLRQMNVISARNSATAARASYEAGRKQMPAQLDRLQRLGTN